MINKIKKSNILKSIGTGLLLASFYNISLADIIAPSDGASGDYFGYSVLQSGNFALIGAQSKNSAKGAAYVYDISNSANNYGEIKLTVSDAANNDYFGISVSIDGDNFTVGASGKNGGIGAAYTGTVSSMSTLDDGTSKVIKGISFKSQRDWIIGENNSGNTVTLSAGDTANVTNTGKAIYIGKEASSNNNKLIVQGKVEATTINVGAAGNTDNQLYIADTGDISGVDDIFLNIGSSIFFEGESDFFAAFDSTELQMLDNGTWTIVNAGNYDDLIARGILDVTVDASGMLVQYGVIPEPAEVAALLGLLALGFAAYRRRK